MSPQNATQPVGILIEKAIIAHTTSNFNYVQKANTVESGGNKRELIYL